MTINWKNTILLDCDGPCAEFDQAALEALDMFSLPHPSATVGVLRSIKQEQGDAAYDRAKLAIAYAQQFQHTFGVVPGAIEAVHTLRGMGFTIHWCTSPLHKGAHWCENRVKWIKQNFGVTDPSKPWLDVTFTKEKSLVRGLTLIDDWDYHINKWNQVNNPNYQALWFDNQASSEEGAPYWEHIVEQVKQLCS